MPTLPPLPDAAVRDACRQLGLAEETVDALIVKLSATAPTGCGEAATSRELEMMLLLKSPTPDKLVHDLRNVLNEVMLLRAMADL